MHMISFGRISVKLTGTLGLATKPATEAKKPTSENLEQNMKSLNISSGSSAASLTADLERVAKSRRNLDVLDEYKKSKAKENINFVVIGTFPNIA